MAARFLCNTTFEIPARKSFVLVGRVLEGTVRAGMVARVPFNKRFVMTLDIKSITTVSTASGLEIGLVVEYGDPEELDFLRGTNIGEEELEITEA